LSNSLSRLASAAIAAGLIAAFCGIAAADRNALWTIVHDKCVPDQEEHHDPAPCEVVNLDGGVEKGYAILKDRNGATQFLLIPTRRISGIESPEALAPDMPNYWEPAWQARSFVEARAKHKLAWDMIGLAINPALRRSQDQLHIHIDCLRPDVHAALAEHIGEIGMQWAELPFDLHGQHYMARRLDEAELAREDPFKLLAGGLGGSSQDLAAETLVLVGVRLSEDKNGFVLLADRGAPEKGILAHGEDLLDHACALATPEEAASGKRGER
jgi:CDP-diacylglycerol pyrophosphatase